jgi:hypothetical protein
VVAEMDWDLKDWVILVLVMSITLAITTIVFLGIINSMAGKFLRLQKFRDWFITKSHNHRWLLYILYFLQGCSAVPICEYTDSAITRGILIGIVFGVGVAITYEPKSIENNKKYGG